MKTYIKQAGLFVGTFLVAVGFSYALAASGWTGPTVAAPNGNAAAPLNVASSTQIKLGSLILNGASPIQNAIGLVVFGTSTFNGTIQVIDGTQGSGKVLTSDGSGNAAWQSPVSGGGIPSTIQKITSTGTWTVPAGVTKIDVRVWGAGGGGGNASGSGGNGGGGGAGGYAESILTVTPGTVYTVTIGAGGAGEAGSGTGGTAGTGSSFSTLVVAGGGGAGLKDSSGSTGGAGGVASVGQITINGQAGQTNDSSNDNGGSGGNSPQGGQGGLGARSFVFAGTVPGGGGSGSGNGLTNTAGAGANGMIIVEY